MVEPSEDEEHQTYLLTLAIKIPKGFVMPPQEWNFDGIFNADENPETYTPVALIDCTLFPIPKEKQN